MNYPRNRSFNRRDFLAQASAMGTAALLGLNELRKELKV